MAQHDPPTEMVQAEEDEIFDDGGKSFDDHDFWPNYAKEHPEFFEEYYPDTDLDDLGEGIWVSPAKYDMVTINGDDLEDNKEVSDGTRYQPNTFSSPHKGDVWKALTISLPPVGVTSLRLSGTVETDSEDTYVPIRVKSGGWRCFDEGGPGGYEDGCLSLSEYYWARNGYLPPLHFDSEEAKREYYEKNTIEDGLAGANKCAVTRDTPMNVGTIGSDIFPGLAQEKYLTTFDLHANPAVTYVGSLTASEDLCDQSVFHVALCDDDTPENPDSPDSPETTSPKRPGITIPHKPDENSDIPSSSSVKPEPKDDESEDSNEPKEDDEDKITGTTSTQAPEAPEEEDTPVDKVETPDRGGFYPGSNPQPVNSTQTAGGSTISDETGAPEAKGEPEGLEVNTGGKTERRSLKQVIVDWILQK